MVQQKNCLSWLIDWHKLWKHVESEGFCSMKTLVGHNPRDSWERSSVPEGRQDVATGASPWYAMMERRKSRRDDRNSDWVVSCRPFRTENHLCFLQPRAHARGYNLPPHSWLKRRFDSPRNASHESRVLAEKILHGVARQAGPSGGGSTHRFVPCTRIRISGVGRANGCFRRSGSNEGNHSATGRGRSVFTR